MFKETTNEQLTHPAIVFLDKRAQKLSLLLISMGSIVVHLYLFTVRSGIASNHNILFGGVLMQSVGMLLTVSRIILRPERELNKALFMIRVLTMSFSIAYTRVSRFSVPFQADVPAELQAAQLMQDRWVPDLMAMPAPAGEKGVYGFLITNGYVATLSVTIFPSMVSEVLGVDLLDTFRFFMPIIVGLMPLFLFLVIRKFFGDTAVTYLSVALLPFTFYFTYFMQFFRSAIAISFLYLLLYSLRVRERRGMLLSTIFGFSVVSAHYTAGYYTGFLLITSLVSSLVLSRIFRWTKERLVTFAFLITYVVILVAWMIYTQRFLFSAYHVDSILSYFVHLKEITFAPESFYLTSSPRGPIVTAWFDLQLLLISVGGLTALYQSLRGRLKEAESIWVLAGCILIAYTVVATVAPVYVGFSMFIEPARGVAYALPFLMVFLAWVFTRMKIHHRKPKLGVNLWKFFALLFIFLMLPMNMMLPSIEHDLMYNPHWTQTPETQATWFSLWSRGQADLVAVDWIGSHISASDFVQTDNIGYKQMEMGLVPAGKIERYRSPYLMPSSVSLSRSIRVIHYLVVHNFFLDYGIWIQIYPNRTWTLTKYDPNTLLQDPVGSLIYNNEVLALFYAD